MTLPLGMVNGNASTNAADPATTLSNPSGRVTTRSTNISEPEGDADCANSGEDAIISAITHTVTQCLG